MGVSRRQTEEKTVFNGFRRPQRVWLAGLKPLKTVLPLWPHGPTPIHGGVNKDPDNGYRGGLMEKTRYACVAYYLEIFY
jgi:hypothetical protein